LAIATANPLRHCSPGGAPHGRFPGLFTGAQRPYAGGYTTKLYGQPDAGVHALQIEVSRALYLDEATLEKTRDFAQARDRLCRLARSLIVRPWSELPRRQTAAE